MNTIALTNFKGGTGKTSLSIHLAVAFYEMGVKTVILDMNPGYYGTDDSYTKRWAQQRENGPTVMHEPDPPPHLKDYLQSIGTDLIIMDVPGRVQLANFYAMHTADLVIIPTSGPLDYVVDTMSLAKRCHAKTYVLMTNIYPSWTAYNRRAKIHLDGLRVPLVPTTIYHRSEYRKADWLRLGVTEYDPTSRGAQEISFLRSWIIKRFKQSWKNEKTDTQLMLERICPLEHRAM